MQKSSWQTKKIGDICTVIAGQSPEGQYYNKIGDGLPFYQGKKEFTDKFIGTPTTWTTKVTKEAYNNDLLMSVRAPVGPVNFATERICIGRGLAAIRGEEHIDRDFLFYFFLKFENEIEGNRGAVFDSINKNQIENIQILVPTISVQKRIVKVLDEVFEKIEKVKENTEKNLHNSRELYEAYLQTLITTFSRGGKTVIIEDVCDSIIDCINKTAPITNIPTPYKMIRTTNVRNGTVNLDSVRYVSEKTYYNWTRRQIPKRGDILLTREAPLGEAGMLLSDEPVFLGQRIVSYRANPTKLDNWFLLYVMQSKSFQNQIKSLASGSTVQHMRVPDSKKLQFYLPPLNSQKLTVNKLRAVSEQTKNLEMIYKQQLTNLEELKKSILQKAFAGEL